MRLYDSDAVETFEMDESLDAVDTAEVADVCLDLVLAMALTLDERYLANRCITSESPDKLASDDGGEQPVDGEFPSVGP